MKKDKSLMEKFADTVRDVAKTATDAASAALQPPAASKADRRAAGYVPLAADGLVSDPMMVAPSAEPRPRREKRATRRMAKSAARKPAKKTARKSSAKSAKKSASRAAARKTARKTKTGTRQRVAKSRRR